MDDDAINIDIDKMLCENGAVIEKANGKFYIKFRVFASELPTPCEPNQIIEYRDQFFDDKFFSNGKNNTYYRRRWESTESGEKLVGDVRQSFSTDLSVRCHCYFKEVLRTNEFSPEVQQLNSFVELNFKRKVFDYGFDKNGFEQIFCDCLTDNGFTQYSVWTFRRIIDVPFQDIPNLIEACEKSFPLIDHTKEKYPVFSKFMYVLQCKPTTYKLSDTVFKTNLTLCSDINGAIEKMKKDKVDIYREHAQLYLCYMYDVIAHYKLCYMEEHSFERAQDVVNEIITSCRNNKDHDDYDLVDDDDDYLFA